MIESYHMLHKAVDNYNLALICMNQKWINKANDNLTDVVKHICGLD